MKQPIVGPKTFAELEALQSITATELIETMRDYVETRSGISTVTVADLIRKTLLSDEERDLLKELCIQGCKQEAKGNFRTACDYLKVFSLL
ncbi:MAG: hypothetical protein V4686_00820 [Patescibacteria group bacterium]